MKALFLDRDGVVNIENNYVYKVDDFIFMDYIFELCRLALRKKYKIFIALCCIKTLIKIIWIEIKIFTIFRNFIKWINIPKI